jgi:peptidoglycan/LPS O-acetylase OafA/YrhL
MQLQREAWNSSETACVTTHIAAVDGLRFLAAFLVMAGQSNWYVISRQQRENLRTVFDWIICGLLAPNMTPFFVLSGWHQRYARKHALISHNSEAVP